MLKQGCFPDIYQFQKMIFLPNLDLDESPRKKQTLDIGSLEKPYVNYSTMYMKDNLMRIIFNKEVPRSHAKSQLKDRPQRFQVLNAGT